MVGILEWASTVGQTEISLLLLPLALHQLAHLLHTAVEVACNNSQRPMTDHRVDNGLAEERPPSPQTWLQLQFIAVCVCVCACVCVCLHVSMHDGTKN